MTDEEQPGGAADGESPPGDPLIGKEAIERAFGEENRARLLKAYFAQSGGPPAPQSAWEDVYRLLLWVDKRTGIAHCYESDKSQPGEAWYPRSLAFHDWVSSGLQVPPGELAGAIDWLFRMASVELDAAVARQAGVIAAKAALQRGPYEGRGFPEPGEGAEIERVVRGLLGPYLAGDPPAEVWERLGQQIREYIASDSNRRNLLGEGFEDVLAAIIRRIPGTDSLELITRRLLHELPGFNREREGDKPNKVDLAVLRPAGLRTLVTAKWSLRGDREKQFDQEYDEYVAAESARQPFEYVLATNEFDPARLMRACERLKGNNYMFSRVVHISTDALRAAYGGAKLSKTMRKVIGFIDGGRLVDLSAWIQNLAAP